MPKTSPALTEIGKLYQRSFLNALMYGFISGVQWSLPSVQKKEAAEMFLKRFKIAKHVMSVDVVLATYDKMHKEVLDEERQQE